MLADDIFRSRMRIEIRGAAYAGNKYYKILPGAFED